MKLSTVTQEANSEEHSGEVTLSQGRGKCSHFHSYHHGASETVGIGSGLWSLSTGVSVFIKQGSLVSLTPVLLHILMIKMFTEVCLSKTLPSPVRYSCAVIESISRFPHRCLHMHDCNGMEFNDMNKPVGAAPWASCAWLRLCSFLLSNFFR